jgi:hypothetical protein
MLPDQKVDANTVANASFAKDAAKSEFTTALLYKLQRKRLEPNDQSNANSAPTENISTSIQLLVIWKSDINDKGMIFARALLIKHSNAIDWDKNTLEKVHSMHLALCRDDRVVKDTWLLNDEKVLMMTSKWKKESRTIKITISEGSRKDDSRDPLWVSTNM